jgi:choice-of-anchor B domain-containing protein
MKKIHHLHLLIFSFFIFIFISGQQNIQLLNHVNKSSFSTQPGDLNDIWGWVDSLGNEYAIVGTQNGTFIFDVTDPLNPNEVFHEPGISSIWRDIKTHGNYAYVTTEAQNGLLIIDLNPLPSSTAISTYYYNGPSGYQWASAHNLFIDDRGYVYIFGANRANKGCIILDINQDPTLPVEVGVIDNWRTHDGMVMGDTLIMAHVSPGIFSMWDVSDPSNPVQLGQQTTPGAFCHNIWTSDDGNQIYTSDEISNGFIAEYNISDLSNITIKDQIQASPGNNVIPHNTHFINDYLVTSYYTYGVVIHDVSQEGNMIEVGNFDTSPVYSGDGFFGCWGVYPWLPSGNLIASDIEEGFYVLGPTYTRAAYLEGSVTDAVSLSPVNGADVEIISANVINSTNILGDYQSGCSDSGLYDIIFSHPVYQSDTVFGVSLVNDSTTILNHQLFSLNPVNIIIETKDLMSNNSIVGTELILQNNGNTYTGNTGSNGLANFNNVLPGNYQLFAGKWGFREYCNTLVVSSSSLNPITIEMETGYQDRFNTDQGWTISGTSPYGIWERDLPVATFVNSDTANPGRDSYDCGSKAYITGNTGGAPSIDDVDLQFSLLTSPIISLPTNQQNKLYFTIWWKDFASAVLPNDSLIIWANDGTNKEAIFYAYPDDNFNWLDTSVIIPNTIDLGNFQLEIQASDWLLLGDNIVEAGFDNFSINRYPIGIEVNSINYVMAYPNPTIDGNVYLECSKPITNYKLYDLSGRLIKESTYIKNENIKLPFKGYFLLEVYGIGFKETLQLVH